MTDGTGVRIVLTRWTPALAAVVLLTTAVLAAGPVVALLDAERLGDRIFLGVLTVVFGAPFLWVLWRIPKAMRGMGIAVDHNGVHEFDGRRTATVEWPEIERVGFGSYSRMYRGLKTRSLPGFEVYRKGDRQPVIRCTVSPYGDNAERLERAVKRFRPELWAGPFTHDR